MVSDHLRRTNARCPFNNSNTRAPPPLVQGVQHETTGTSTDFTDASNACSSMAGVILQDWDTPASLEQRIMEAIIPTQDSYVYKNPFTRTNSDSNI